MHTKISKNCFQIQRAAKQHTLHFACVEDVQKLANNRSDYQPTGFQDVPQMYRARLSFGPHEASQGSTIPQRGFVIAPEDPKMPKTRSYDPSPRYEQDLKSHGHRLARPIGGSRPRCCSALLGCGTTHSHHRKTASRREQNTLVSWSQPPTASNASQITS